MPIAVAEKVPENGVYTSLTANPSGAALMAELVESSRNLPNSSTSLGSIRLGLSEIQARAQELRRKLPVENNTKAYVMAYFIFHYLFVFVANVYLFIFLIAIIFLLEAESMLKTLSLK